MERFVQCFATVLNLFYFALLLFNNCELCNGFPINLENNAIADSHTQLLTGLVAVLLTVCSVVFLAGCLCCQRRTNGFKDEKAKEFRDSPVVASTSSNLDHGHVNPVANGEFTIFTPLSPPHQNNNVFLANQQVIIRTQDDYTYGDINVSSWFDGSEDDFPRIKLKYIKEIGRGWFGKVVEGAAYNPENYQHQENDAEGQKWTPVAVRILEATASTQERVLFLHDAAIYRGATQHSNILKLFGRCLDTIPLLILQEYCPQGDLKKYLRENQPTADKLLNTEYPLIWCCQLTSALKHVHQQLHLSHPDLAARNCQLTSNLTLKLGDYGLAVSHYPNDYYEGAAGVSVRWCAPESIAYTSTTIEAKNITREANIWSLGVTIWEICECGQQPYAELSDDDVISQVLGSANVRLNRPKLQVFYTDYLYRLMQLCWTSSESRPAVSQIDLMLADLLQVYKNTTTTTTSLNSISNEDFDKRWQSFKPNSIVKTDNADNELEIVVSKPLSPSLNNLHGSLDNLTNNEANAMESWLENVATNTGDMSFVKGLSDAMKDLDNALALENTSTSCSDSATTSPQKIIEFKLGPLHNDVIEDEVQQQQQQDSMTDSMIFKQRGTSSTESETEEENWKTKIERGAYSEKVRQKSRSVADLMILTHIDQSESEPETPLPSLPYYKNVRCAPNLEGAASLMFGSEGNLLNVENEFEEELKKLQVERRDSSMLFVPENNSNSSSGSTSSDKNLIVDDNVVENDSPSKRLLQELNSPSEMQPVNQVYNVFNVSVDIISPVHLTNQSKLNEIINLENKEEDEQMEVVVQNEFDDHQQQQVPKLVDIIQSNSELVNYLTNNPIPTTTTMLETTKSISLSSSEADGENGEILYDSGVEGDRMESTESLRKLLLSSNLNNGDNQLNDDNCGQNIVTTPSDDLSNTLNDDLDDDLIVNKKSTDLLLRQVPKLVDLIQDNDALMDYIIAKYESEVNLDKGNNENFDSLESENGSFTLKKSTKDLELIDFDLSEHQDETMPNSLTHSNLVLATNNNSNSSNLANETENEMNSLNLFVENLNKETKVKRDESKLYSLETWDNFLGKSFDNSQSEKQDENEQLMFDSFTSDEPPQSLTSLEATNEADEDENSEQNDKTYTIANEKSDEVIDLNDINVEVDSLNGTENWDGASGWFLHPQSNNENISGEINIVQPNATSDSYVGFNMDDEIMAAIRNELLNKLPQAQSGSNALVDGQEEREEDDDDDEWETTDRNEVFLKYNVYNTPLSPIPEENSLEMAESDGNSSAGQSNDEEESSDEDGEWSSDQCEVEDDVPDGSPMHAEPLNRHTPSQESCCSNDTLFNLEELTCGQTTSTPTTTQMDLEFNKHESCCLPAIETPLDNNDDDSSHNVNNDESSTLVLPTEKESHEENNSCSNNTIKQQQQVETIQVETSNETLLASDIDEVVAMDKEILSKDNYIAEFLINERNSCVVPIVDEPLNQENSSSNQSFLKQQQIAPLPSPEDNPWKQLPASLLNYDRILAQNLLLPAVNESNTMVAENAKNSEEEENCGVSYENVTNIDDIYNEADYVNIVNMENSKNTSTGHDEDGDETEEYILNGEEEDDDVGHDVFGVLTDIRFSGPSDSQLMTTSFSESNDLNDDDEDDEQDWDSGSDTRSSSSGEFIWKEGEHEESLKALRAAPQDSLDDVKPMEGIMEEASSCTSEESSSSDDDDGDSPEFVPSAWDKYATPTKSAMRSPEKTLEKTEGHCDNDNDNNSDNEAKKKKSKGVWFKKQKYHCVYEYPREPESPVLHSYDLWQPPQPDFTAFAGGDNGRDDEFYISSSSKPFDILNGLSSQFFPGGTSPSWMLGVGGGGGENATPDSGVEDAGTPGDLIDDFKLQSKLMAVQSLKSLADEALRKSKKAEELKGSEVLGGLRHTRNKLKLDLPPSPSAFTSSKMFNIEQQPQQNVMDSVSREKPSFTTFGKSRFLVQHVETPPDDDKMRNVSFEAIPYKPMESLSVLNHHSKDKEIVKTNNNDDDYDDTEKSRQKVEIVRGEASLLDSADEDSGIESSTLERKLSNSVVE